MATDKQIEANRANASKSTGPRTEKGKQVTRLNAVSHGLTAQSLVIPGEDPAALDQFRAEIREEFDPQRPTEEELVDRLASLMWRMRRVPVLEAALYVWMHHHQSALHDTEDVFGNVLSTFDPDTRKLPPPTVNKRGEAVFADMQLRLGRLLEAVSQNDLLNKLARHEAHLMNQLKKTIQELVALIRERAEN